MNRSFITMFFCLILFFSSLGVFQKALAMNEEEDEEYPKVNSSGAKCDNVSSSESKEKEESTNLSAQTEDLGTELDERNFSTATSQVPTNTYPPLPQESSIEEEEEVEGCTALGMYPPKELVFDSSEPQSPSKVIDEEEKENTPLPSCDNSQSVDTHNSSSLSEEDRKEVALIEEKLMRLVPFAHGNFETYLAKAKELGFGGVPADEILATQGRLPNGMVVNTPNKKGIYAYALGYYKLKRKKQEELKSKVQVKKRRTVKEK